MGRVKDWMMELEWQQKHPNEHWYRTNKMISEVNINDMASESIRTSVLNEANRIVNGERANTYGGPEDSFKTIAGFWSTYLKTEAPLEPSDVAAMLALLKIARLQNSPSHRDSWVDLAGYAACGAECGLK